LSFPWAVAPPRGGVVPAGACSGSAAGGTAGSRQTRFYRPRVAAGGRSARLTPLSIPPLPAGESADDIAVSADGGMLAVAIQFSGARHGAVEAISLATGAVRTWTTTRTGTPETVSWAEGNREAGFFWQDSGRSSGSAATTASGLWILDTATPGSNLMSGRRITPEVTPSTRQVWVTWRAGCPCGSPGHAAACGVGDCVQLTGG
jgi:hypothetical protein